MKNFTYQQIYYFQITMQCSSFSQAAEKAFTTQSNISKNISNLEKMLGQPLFIRQKKGIIPTQKAILLNAELNHAETKIRKLFDLKREEPANKILNIGFCQHIFFPEAIPHFFKLFAEGEPLCEIEVKFHCYEVKAVIEDLIKGKIDLGFILSDYNFSNHQIKMKTVKSEPPRIYFSKNCPLAAKENISVLDFSDYSIITTRYLIEQNDFKMINNLPFTPKSIQVVDTYDDISLYLATGNYITILRPYVSLAFNKDIRSITLNNYDVSQGISMIWLAKQQNKYIDLLVREMDQPA